MLPINNVKSNSPLSTMHILNMTSSQLLVGSRSFPKVLQELVGIMKTDTSQTGVAYIWIHLNQTHLENIFARIQIQFIF